MANFKTRKALLKEADYIIKAAEHNGKNWDVLLVNQYDGQEKSLNGVKIFNNGNSFGAYGMNAGLYELEDVHGNVTIAAVPERNTLLFLLG